MRFCQINTTHPGYFYFNNVIYEGDKWLKSIYPISSRFQGFKNKNYPLMNATRRNIRKCLFDVFYQNIDKLNINIMTYIKIKLFN